MSIRPRDFFQIGLVVADLDAAMVRFASLGYTFCAVFEQSLPLGGDGVFVRTALTREFPHVKLVEAHGELAERLDVVHLGVWVDDIEAASADLQAAGMPVVLAGAADGDGSMPWAYHVLGEGSLLELISRRTQPFFRALFGDQESSAG